MHKKILLAVLTALCMLLLCQCARTSPEDTVSTQESITPPTQTEATDPEATEPEPTQPLPTVPEEPEQEPLMAMGDIRITTTGSIRSEYTEATVSMVWEDGGIEEQTAQIRYRGYTSSFANKKSYNIKFESKESVMGMPKAKKWTFLGNPYDKSLLRSVVGFSYGQAVGLEYTSEFRLCRLWLNGEYRGVYLIVEPIDIGKGRVDIDENAGDFIVERNNTREEEGVTYIKTDGGLRFEMSDPDEVTQEQAEACLAVLNEIEAAIRTKDYATYSQYIDVDSFVNFYLFQEMIKDIDFARFSTRYYVCGGILYAGPPWDFDLSMGNISTSYIESNYKRYGNRDGYGNGSGDSTQALWAQKDFYQWLCKDDYFMQLVAARWQEIRPITENLFRDNEMGTNLLDRYLDAYLTDLEGNYSEAGWSVSKPLLQLEYNYPASDYVGNVELLRGWLEGRMAWLDTQFGTGAEG